MQALVDDIKQQLCDKLCIKVPIDIHGDDVEHWLKIERSDYKACLYFEKMWEQGDYYRTAVTFYDNQRPLANFDDVYTNDDIDEGMPLIIDRINMFLE